MELSTTPTDQMPQPVIRSLADLVAAIPALVGEDLGDLDVCVVGYRGPGRAFALCVELASPSTMPKVAASLMEAMVHRGYRRVYLAGYGHAYYVSPALTALRTAAEDAGVKVIGAVNVSMADQVWWSYLTPERGRLLDNTRDTAPAAPKVAGDSSTPASAERLGRTPRQALSALERMEVAAAVTTVFGHLTTPGAERFERLVLDEGLMVRCPDCHQNLDLTAEVCDECGWVVVEPGA